MSIDAVLANQARWHIECCDARDGLRKLPAKSIHCVVTSPPYWSLRNYQIPPSIWGGQASCSHDWAPFDVKDVRHSGRGSVDGKRKERSRPIASTSDTCRLCGAWRGCFGAEPSIELYVRNSLELLGEIHRVLRDDGVCWWNVGDGYGNDSKWGGYTTGLHAEELHLNDRQSFKSGQPDLSKLMIPHRVALAAQAAGWVVRQDVVWQKLSPMPESVQSHRFVRCRWKAGKDDDGKTLWRDCDGCDRCFEHNGQRLRLQRGAWRSTTAHEYIFQLVKGGEYFCDAEAVKERAVGDRPGNRVSGKLGDLTGDNGKAARMAALRVHMEPRAHRNPRSVWYYPQSIWPLAHEPLKEKHFAPFPSAIPRRCILASTSSKGVCAQCGANWAPIVERERVATRPGATSKVYDGEILKPGSPYRTHRGDICGNKDPRRHTTATKVLGWLPTCQCGVAGYVAEPVPAVVLDLFLGSGTTGRVAYSLGRRFIGFDISEKYIAIARERIVKPFTKRRSVPKHKRPMKDQKPLFE